MKKRYFGLAINVVFYGILLFNWYVTANYGADYLVHAGVVIFLWLSYMEKESFEKIKYWIISDCIFITKFFMIIIQILFLSYGLQDIYYYVLFAFCCIATFITEMFLIRRIKTVKVYKGIIDNEVNQYIDKYYFSKFKNSLFKLKGENESNIIDKKMKLSAVSGLQTIALGISIIFIYIMKLFNKNIYFTHKNVVLGFVLLLMIVLNWIILAQGIKNSIWVSICTVFGITLLFIAEVVFYWQMDTWRMLIWALVGLLFAPMVEQKINISESLKKEIV